MPTKADIRDYFMIALGMCIYSFGYSCFVLPYSVVGGGLGGICALIYFATGIPTQYPYALINLCLLVWAIFELGWKFLYKTIWAVAIVTVAIAAWQEVVINDDGTMTRLVGDDRFMAVFIGAILEGVGISMAFLYGGSSGGTDIIAAIVHKHRDISLGRVILVTDFMVVLSSYLVLKTLESVVVGIVLLTMANLVIDYVLNSTKGSVQFIIISNKHHELAQAINKELDRGVTYLHGQGGYSGEEKQVLFVLVRKREQILLRRLINRIDPKAFVSQSVVAGVYGEGFDKIIKK